MQLYTRDIVWASLSEYIHALVYGAIPLEGEKRESSGSCVVFPSPHLCLSLPGSSTPAQSHLYTVWSFHRLSSELGHLSGPQWSSLSIRTDGLVNSDIYSDLLVSLCANSFHL